MAYVIKNAEESGVRNKTISDLPVIHLTGHADVPLADGAMGKGAFGFIEKPVNIIQLEEHLKAAFSAEVQCRR